MSILTLQKSKKNQQQQAKVGRFLITVNVIGSAGPIRFLVNEEELVAAVIDTALRSYAKEGRLPVLGSDFNNFFLYCANAGSDALSPLGKIGSSGGRNFVLSKKQQLVMDGGNSAATTPTETLLGRKRSGSWKAWLNRSLNLKVYSH